MAVISEVVASVSAHLPILIVGILAIHLVRNFVRRGVSKIPGPFLAKISNIWRFVDVARGRAHETHIKLHARYGQYVRLGPNLVSVQNLEAMKIIYGANKGYRKVSSTCHGEFVAFAECRIGSPIQPRHTAEATQGLIRGPIYDYHRLPNL
ncbi:pisatin demethylase [Colletotrichum cuscutae]|uniref:Pisatin demethylase n=1 Tax=Colletotrichum cuscutae TaxID=1209917 RepID=A0AAI9UY23_9PEZI|nr:pisatin demethylase [Colletotrichum cuscutae]